MLQATATAMAMMEERVEQACIRRTWVLVRQTALLRQYCEMRLRRWCVLLCS